MQRFRLMTFITAAVLMVQSASAQTNAASPASIHTYYIFVKETLTRADVLNAEKAIRQHPGVQKFLGTDFPVKYFVLQTKSPLPESSFRSWWGSRVAIAFYGEEGVELEKFITAHKTSVRKAE